MIKNSMTDPVRGVHTLDKSEPVIFLLLESERTPGRVWSQPLCGETVMDAVEDASELLCDRGIGRLFPDYLFTVVFHFPSCEEFRLFLLVSGLVYLSSFHGLCFPLCFWGFLPLCFHSSLLHPAPSSLITLVFCTCLSFPLIPSPVDLSFCISALSLLLCCLGPHLFAVSLLYLFIYFYWPDYFYLFYNLFWPIFNLFPSYHRLQCMWDWFYIQPPSSFRTEVQPHLVLRQIFTLVLIPTSLVIPWEPSSKWLKW